MSSLSMKSLKIQTFTKLEEYLIATDLLNLSYLEMVMTKSIKLLSKCVIPSLLT